MPRILTNSTTIFLVFNILIKNRTHFIRMKSLIAARMLSANHLLCIKINVELFCVCLVFALDRLNASFFFYSGFSLWTDKINRAVALVDCWRPAAGSSVLAHSTELENYL